MKLPGLNALRFIAASLVVIQHTESLKDNKGIVNWYDYGLFRSGSLAVTFFFVLSGFLITFLLLKEREQDQTISISKFYLRRVLRIWPLYFLAVFLGLVLLPLLSRYFHIDFKKPYHSADVWRMFIFMTPYLCNYIYPHHFLQALWSIGVEENFYLFWAPLVKKFYAHLGKVIFFIYGTWMLLICYANNVHLVDRHSLFSFLVNHLQFEALSLGAFGACLVHYGWINSRVFGNQFIQAIIYGLVVSKFLFIPMEDHQLRIFMEFGFIYIILNTAFNEQALLKLTAPFLEKLGDFSYGMYIYHVFVIGFTIKFIHQPVMVSIVSFGLVVLVSWISKVTFENFFLRLKPY